MFEFQTKFDIIPNLSYLQISKNWKNESFFLSGAGASLILWIFCIFNQNSNKF